MTGDQNTKDAATVKALRSFMGNLIARSVNVYEYCRQTIVEGDLS